MKSTKKKKPSLQKDIEYRDLVGRLTLLDDIYMKVFFRDNIECTEYVLRIILGKPNLSVKSVSVDHVIPSIGTKSVRLDVYAEDSEGKKYDIEMQNVPEPSITKRARYYASAMALSSLGKGEGYGAMRETYVVFVCNYDPFGKGLLLYTGEMMCNQDTSISIYDGCRLAYVNCAKSDESTELGRLVHDIRCSDYASMHNEVLAKHTKSVKSTLQEDKRNMIMTVTEELRQEAIKEGLREGREKGRKEGRREGRREGRKDVQVESAGRMLQAGISVKDIAKYLGMTIEEVEEIVASA